MVVSVLTSDIIDSSKLKKKELILVHETINTAFENLQECYQKEVALFEIYRGDSFQGIVLNPVNALKIAFYLKTSIKKLNLGSKHSSKAKKSVVDFRMALGIGKIDALPENLKEASGEAFIFSGRTLDAMKSKQQKMSLKCENENINHEFAVHFKFFDLLTERWSMASAEVVYYLLQDRKEIEIAKKLGISQSAVNSRKKASGWEAISILLRRYEEVITSHFSENQKS